MACRYARRRGGGHPLPGLPHMLPARLSKDQGQVQIPRQALILIPLLFHLLTLTFQMDSPHEEPPSGPSKRRRTTTPLEDFPDDDDIWASLGFAGPPPLCLRVLIVDGLIVGARYYLGQVVVSEALGFTRDPDNEHDSNAICVDNSSGCQVGQ